LKGNRSYRDNLTIIERSILVYKKYKEAIDSAQIAIFAIKSVWSFRITVSTQGYKIDESRTEREK